jgi:hypothetical protein
LNELAALFKPPTYSDRVKSCLHGILERERGISEKAFAMQDVLIAELNLLWTNPEVGIVVGRFEQGGRPEFCAECLYDKHYGKKLTASTKTFNQIRDAQGPGHTHHLRLHCVVCGTTETCRCSAPKEDFDGICWYCEEKAAGRDPEETFRMDVRALAIAKRICQGTPLPKVAGLLQDLDRKTLRRTLWYENEAGEIWEPNLEGNPFDPPPPEGFFYQHSAFPTMLRHSVLKLTQRSEVDVCPHDPQYVVSTYDWVEPYEGRKCNVCGGTQQRIHDMPWPDEWEANGSRDCFASEQSWSEDLMLGLVQKGFSVREAIMAAATCCERCMNVLAYECGLDWGYALDSDDWVKCNTSCQHCKKLGEEA